MDEIEWELQSFDPLFPLRFIQEVYTEMGGEGEVRMHQSGMFSAKSPKAFRIAVECYIATYELYTSSAWR